MLPALLPSAGGLRIAAVDSNAPPLRMMLLLGKLAMFPRMTPALMIVAPE